MRTEFAFPSCGAGKIRGYRWTPAGAPKAIVQIIHGIAEHSGRYDAFAQFLNEQGYLVVAEDHMGHGRSIGPDSPVGYFTGGWFAAVEDSYTLMKRTQEEFPSLPYVLLGHSMGSFMARTLLIRYPDSGIRGAIIMGTGWQPRKLLPAAEAMCREVCRRTDERCPSPRLNNLVFGTYNRKVEHPRTSFDWLSRNERSVDAYIADPLCGTVASAGLLRDMLTGIRFIEEPVNLAKMNRKLSVLFISGEADPVGHYGRDVERCAAAFRQAGMRDITKKLYPLGRHEILNEINSAEIFQEIQLWIQEKLG